MSDVLCCPACGFNLAPLALRESPPNTCPGCDGPIDWAALFAAQQQTPTHSDHPLLLVAPLRSPHGDLIDMTAMVDIVFFLLIFFLVTSMQSLESVLNLPTPQGPAAASAVAKTEDISDDPSFVTVTIYDDDSVWVEDQEAFGDQDLRAKLREIRKQNRQITGMLVLGSADANHGAFVGVLDAAADAGLEELKFSVMESEDAPPLAGS